MPASVKSAKRRIMSEEDEKFDTYAILVGKPDWMRECGTRAKTG
jgi:hypothetical protein